MFNRQQWAGILRDAIFISLFQFLLMLFLRVVFGFDRLSATPSLLMVLSALGFFAGIAVFCIIGIRVKANLWPHLVSVGLIVFLVLYGRGIINIYISVKQINPDTVIFGNGPLNFRVLVYMGFSALAGTFVTVLVGGALAAMIRKRQAAC